MDELTVTTAFPTICVEVYELGRVGSNDIFLGRCDVEPATYLRRKTFDAAMQPSPSKSLNENTDKLVPIQGLLCMTLGMIENPSAGRLTGRGEKPFHLSDVPYQSKISDMRSLQPIHAVEICILKMTRTDDWPLALGSVAESSIGGGGGGSSIGDGTTGIGSVAKVQKVTNDHLPPHSIT
jgi:hypothetical protein